MIALRTITSGRSSATASGVTVIFTVFVTAGLWPSLAVNVAVYALGAAVVLPDTVPVRLPLSLNFNPAGSPLALSATLSAAFGSVAETLKLSGSPEGTLWDPGTVSVGGKLGAGMMLSWSGTWPRSPLESVAVMYTSLLVSVPVG